jgi:polyisoprenoid-binding protein YceI
MKHLIYFSLALILSTSAWADSETYIIDSNHTYPRFSYNHLGFSTQVNRFDHTTGKIIIDRKAKTATVQVQIDTNTVDTGNSKFNEHIQGEDFFDTAKYPTISFTSSSAEFTDDQLSSVSGDLTIKGITHPVTLKLSSFQCMPHPMLKKDACGANAITTVKRSDYNMSKYVPAVSDEVTIYIAVEAVKE